MNPRQRITLQRSWLTVAGQLVAGLVGLALLWGAVVVGLLVAGVAPGTVRSVTGYDSAYSAVAGIESADVRGGTVRLVVGLGGLVLAVALGFMARAQLPRPHLARGSVGLGDQDDLRGRTVVAPRAVERAVEAAALEHPAVRAARGRYADEGLDLAVGLNQAGDLPATLRAVRGAARESLERHGLPQAPVNVTLAKLDATQGRDLD